mmetsp:Transcript_59008/g.127660  ORF Transcript_59008/g.127660 Transcript_59008/m.127660 type:complete len:213 (-) Transcript_59008:203-841(-)
MHDEPRRRLLLASHHFHQRAVLFPRRRPDEPMVDVVEVHDVHAQMLPGSSRSLRRIRVAPPVAALLGPLHHPPQLLKGDASILQAIDVALEGELLSQLLEVRRVRGPCERELCETLRLGLDLRHTLPGLLLPDGPAVGDKPDAAAPPLPPSLLKAAPDLLSTAHHVGVHHVDLPARLHAVLLRLIGNPNHDGAVPMKAVLGAHSELEFGQAH